MSKLILIAISLFLSSLWIPSRAQADAELGENFFDGEWYFAWGYNRDYWYDSDIHVSQPSLGNDFIVHGVKGQDFAQWTDSNFIFGKDFSIPQFNFRVGRFIGDAQEWAIELSVDHTKFSNVSDQVAHITGTIGGVPVDTYNALSSSYFNYLLHNGANHVMINLLRRFPLFGKLNRTLSVSLLAKGGIGIMLPHSENTIFGQNSDVGPKSLGNMVGFNQGWWQLNGWTAGAELALHFVIFRPVFFEIADKFAFAALSNVPVYLGRADQNVWMNEWLFNVGVTVSPKLGP